jgi:hypothetical protein
LTTLAALISGIVALVELIRACLPKGAQVVFLGDGECDGTALQGTLNEAC